MNPYLLIHRIKWPAMLLVFGVTALLDEWNLISYGKSWPLYLIVLGVLQLAERAAWSQWQQQQYAQGQYAAQGPPAGVGPAGNTPPASSSLVVSPPQPPDDPGRRYGPGEGR
jgi:hypothetical protein